MSNLQAEPIAEFAQHTWFYNWFARGAFRAFDHFPIHKKEALVTIDYLADPMVPRTQGYTQTGIIPRQGFAKEPLALYQAIMKVIEIRGTPIKGMEKQNPTPTRLDLLLTEGPEERYFLWVKEARS